MSTIDRNGDPRLNGPAMALLLVTVILLLHKLAVYFDYLPWGRIPPFLRSGWTTVILTGIALVLWAISLSRAEDKKMGKPDNWPLQVALVTAVLFVASLVLSVVYTFFAA